MHNQLLKALEGNCPQVCFDNLYAAIYVVAKQMIREGFPVDVMVDKLNSIQQEMVKGLNNG